MTADQPTAEGLRRYPETQGYFQNLSVAEPAPDLNLPCTCQPSCPPRCAGDCGCKACDLAFTIFADEMGFYGTGELDEVPALKAYRGG